MPPTVYVASKIFTGDDWLTDHAVIIEKGRITAVVPQSELKTDARPEVFSDALLAPAFIDLQIYGANKKLLAVHPTTGALQDLYAYCRNGGAPLFQPTVATNTPEVFRRSIDAVRQYRQQGGKGVIGLHLEGPWINPVKRGAHLPECIHPPTVEEAKELLEYGKDVISMITLAPEVCSEEVIRLIQSYNIIISAGHSNATFAEASKAFNEWGIPVATHLYNAMSALQHREPGMVGACLLHPLVKASIIPDGYHVDFAALKIAKQLMGSRLFAITDAVTETAVGGYRHQLAGDKYESGGILSGSALTMHAAFVNLVQKAGIETGEALRMCSLYPAQVMKLDKEYGKIAPGYAAHFVLLDQQLNLLQVMNGE